MRISTAGLYQQGLSALLRRQADLAKTQQQLTTGTRLTRAADDPTGAAQAQRIDHAVAALEQFGRSSDLLENRLRLQESALTDAGDILGRARELATQANTATVSPEDRSLIAKEIRHLRASLLAVANRDDGNGRALFAGQRDGVTPFADSAGVVSYSGDDGRNLVDVAPGFALADVDPGSEVFMRIRTGDGEIRAGAATTNTGTGVLHGASVTDPSAWGQRTLTLRFTDATTWTAEDADGITVGGGTYANGDTIAIAGVQTRLTGAPAAGDRFVLQPAPRQDVFASLQHLADALEAPSATPVQQAQLHNALGTALADIGSAQEHFIQLRSSTGSRLASIDDAADTRSENDISLRATLSGLRDTDYAEATSRFALQLTAIEAAQKTMLRLQSSSLFDKL